MKKEKILEQRWKKLNQELAEMGCPAILPKIRPYQDGAWEIVKIVSSYRHSQPFFFVITFGCRKPFTGEIGFWTLKFSTGMVIIPLIDGQLLLKRQHRPATGKWLWEFPRAFTNLLADHEEIRKNFLALIKKDVYRYRKIAVASIISGFIINLVFFTWGMLAPEQFQAKSSFIPAFIVAGLVVLGGMQLQKRRK